MKEELFIAIGVVKQTPEVAESSTSVTPSTAWQPGAVPMSLSTSGVAPAVMPPTLDYEVRFTEYDGTVISVGNASLFQLTGFSVGNTRAEASGSSATDTETSLGPLTLSLAQPELAPQLLTWLTRGGAFKEVDVLGYSISGSGAGQLVTDESFRLVIPTTLSLDNSGVTTLTLDYAGESQGTRLPSTSPGTQGAYGPLVGSSYDTVGSTNSPGAINLPSSLYTEGATVPSSGTALTYYVQFTQQNGQMLTLNGDQLFRLNGFSSEDHQTVNIGSQETGAGAGQATFGPLNLALADPHLAPLLFQDLTQGTAFKEVDVLGYASSAPNAALVQAYSFGLAVVSNEQLSLNKPNQVSLEYRGEAIRTY